MDLTNNSCDHVSFKTIQNGKEEIHEGQPCYSALSYKARLKTVEILCYRNIFKPRLPKEIYLKWMDLCRQHKLIPDHVEYYSDETDNFMKVNISSRSNRQQIFSALCCYRWSTHFQKMVANIVERCQSSDISFWQVLHYYLGITVTNYNHSFTQSSVYGGEAPKQLHSAVALYLYFEKEHFRNYLKNDDEDYAVKSADNVSTLSLQLEFVHTFVNLSDILESRWKPLFEINDRQEAAKVYSELIK